MDEGEDLHDEGDVMICMWEKVGRTKSRWKVHPTHPQVAKEKVVLTQGVVGIQGREWLFERAQGELEF
jgi:hypothetical protein